MFVHDVWGRAGLTLHSGVDTFDFLTFSTYLYEDVLELPVGRALTPGIVR